MTAIIVMPGCTEHTAEYTTTSLQQGKDLLDQQKPAAVKLLCKQHLDLVAKLPLCSKFFCCLFSTFCHHYPSVVHHAPAFDVVNCILLFHLCSVCIWLFFLLPVTWTMIDVALYRRQSAFQYLIPTLQSWLFFFLLHFGRLEENAIISVELCIALHSVIHLIIKTSWSGYTGIWILQWW